MACVDPACGAAKGRGRPKVGWNKLEGIFTGSLVREDRWYCSWSCLAEAAAAEAVHEVPPAKIDSLWD